MHKKKLLIISLLTILLIAVFHYFALKYSWYWTYRWIDIPVHIIGGFWVGVTAMYIFLTMRRMDNMNGYKKKSFLVMMIPVLLVAILWEIFEVTFKITFVHSIGYWQDTLSDISNTFVGGLIAFLYFIKDKVAKNCFIEKSNDSISMIIKH